MIDVSGLAPEQAKRYTLTRDGDRDLTFTGWRVGEGEHGSGGTSGYECDWNRGVKVRIYLTRGGRAVVSRRHWARGQGAGESHEADLYDSAEALLTGLRDEDGRLRAAEKIAWDDACGNVAGLEIAKHEVIE